MTETNRNGWIEWNGGECPVPPYTLVEVKTRNGGGIRGKFGPDLAKDWLWGRRKGHIDQGGDIVSYRVVSAQPNDMAAELLAALKLALPHVESCARADDEFARQAEQNGMHGNAFELRKSADTRRAAATIISATIAKATAEQQEVKR